MRIGCNFFVENWRLLKNSKRLCQASSVPILLAPATVTVQSMLEQSARKIQYQRADTVKIAVDKVEEKEAGTVQRSCTSKPHFSEVEDYCLLVTNYLFPKLAVSCLES